MESTPKATTPQTQAPQTTSKGFAITALVLSILSVVLSIFWLLAIPLAMIAVIFAIIALVKKLAGKGMSIASLVMGGVSLFILIPFWIIISIVTFSSFLNYASQDLPQQSTPNSDSYYDSQSDTPAGPPEFFN